jgi:hypothetical protein
MALDRFQKLKNRALGMFTNRIISVDGWISLQLHCKPEVAFCAASPINTVASGVRPEAASSHRAASAPTRRARHNRSPYLPILELELLRVDLGSVSSRRATSYSSLQPRRSKPEESSLGGYNGRSRRRPWTPKRKRIP